MNNRKIFSLALGLGVGAFMAFGAAAADSNLASAIDHAMDAVNQGKLGLAETLAMKADIALEEAEASEKLHPNPHTAEGITHLKAAIEEGRGKHNAKAGLKHAEEALEHLKAAAK